MTRVWPSRFPSVTAVQPYAGNPGTSRQGLQRSHGQPYWHRRRMEFPGQGRLTGREAIKECGAADFILCGCLPCAQHDDILNVTDSFE